jgi:translation initiation factor 1 (eIF-1/SUI1)
LDPRKPKARKKSLTPRADQDADQATALDKLQASYDASLAAQTALKSSNAQLSARLARKRDSVTVVKNSIDSDEIADKLAKKFKTGYSLSSSDLSKIGKLVSSGQELEVQGARADQHEREIANEKENARHTVRSMLQMASILTPHNQTAHAPADDFDDEDDVDTLLIKSFQHKKLNLAFFVDTCADTKELEAKLARAPVKLRFGHQLLVEEAFTTEKVRIRSTRK